MTASRVRMEFHPDSAWNVPNVQQKTPGDEQRRCPKHVEFYNGINLDN